MTASRPRGTRLRTTLSALGMLVVIVLVHTVVSMTLDGGDGSVVGIAFWTVAMGCLVWLAYLRPVARLVVSTALLQLLAVCAGLVLMTLPGTVVDAHVPGAAAVVSMVLAVVLGIVLVAVRPAGRQPRRGQLWMADVPFEESAGSKDRPCLVVGGSLLRLRVLYITSQDRDHLPRLYRRIDSSRWGGALARKHSWIRLASQDGTSPEIVVRRRQFRRPLGRWDHATRDLVRLAEAGRLPDAPAPTAVPAAGTAAHLGHAYLAAVPSSAPTPPPGWVVASARDTDAQGPDDLDFTEP